VSSTATVCWRACKSHPIIRISASFGPSAVRVNTETVYSDRREAGVVMTSTAQLVSFGCLSETGFPTTHLRMRRSRIVGDKVIYRQLSAPKFISDFRMESILGVKSSSINALNNFLVLSDPEYETSIPFREKEKPAHSHTYRTVGILQIQ
jgi:hypothetical protein